MPATGLKISLGLTSAWFSASLLDCEACTVALLRALHPTGPACPHCGQELCTERQAQAFWSLQRVWCSNCGRGFNALKKTAFEGSKLDPRQILLFSLFLEVGADPAAMAKALGVSLETVRAWRTKLEG